MKFINSITDRFSKVEPLPAGTYHLQTTLGGTPYRLHLRLNADGTGLLIVNASTVLQLNLTAAEYAYHLVQGNPAEEAARWIVEEETTGTWTGISTRMEYVRRLDGEVLGLTPQGTGYLARIRYPAEIFEPGNVPQYLSVVAGNLFGLKKLASVRLLHVEFPPSLIPFRGPKFGIRGVRKIVGTTDLPHVGTIIKPKVG